MPAMTCDVCGGKVISAGRENWFVCEYCETEYPVEWMKAKFKKTQMAKVEVEPDNKTAQELRNSAKECNLPVLDLPGLDIDNLFDRLAERGILPESMGENQSATKKGETQRAEKEIADEYKKVYGPVEEADIGNKAEKEQNQSDQWAEQGLCEYCGGKLNLFGSKCKSCGKQNDYKERGVL